MLFRIDTWNVIDMIAKNHSLSDKQLSLIMKMSEQDFALKRKNNTDLSLDDVLHLCNFLKISLDDFIGLNKEKTVPYTRIV